MISWDEWLKTPGKDYPCPCCFAEFDTKTEKDKHLEVDHNYEPLDSSDTY